MDKKDRVLRANRLLASLREKQRQTEPSSSPHQRAAHSKPQIHSTPEAASLSSTMACAVVETQSLLGQKLARIKANPSAVTAKKPRRAAQGAETAGRPPVKVRLLRIRAPRKSLIH